MQTILIVDDDNEIREGLRILLAGESYNIIEAENGKVALEKMSCAVDLVILDIMMPENPVKNQNLKKSLKKRKSTRV